LTGVESTFTNTRNFLPANISVMKSSPIMNGV